MNARRARAEREIDVRDGNGVRREAGKLRGFDETVHGSVIWHFRSSGREAGADVRAHTRVDGRLDDGRSRPGPAGQSGRAGRLAERTPWPRGPRRVSGQA